MDGENKRALQHVVPIRDREKVVAWMAAQAAVEGEKGLAGKAVDAFPVFFRSSDRRVNLNKARDWWKKRPADRGDTDCARAHKYARSGGGNRHQFVVKAAQGRGPKLGEHWSWLYPILLDEFERLRKAGVKMSTRLLQDIAVTLIEESQHAKFNNGFRINDKPFSTLVTFRRLQDFTDRFNIVYRRLKGKKQVSSDKQEEIHNAVAAHLGELKRLFDDNLIDPSLQFNMDESHFVIDLDDGKTLDFRGAKHVKYRSIVSGREGITMCVLMRGGRNAKILCPMLIFRNKNANYPIQGLPDDVEGVAYRTSPTAFINNTIMKQWLGEVRCWGPGGPFAGERTLWMDNASGHSGDDAIKTARGLRTRVRFFPANATDLVQPADQFPIQRIKEHWRRLCEQRNMAAIRRGDWRQGSGALLNPGKRFFLQTASECVRLVNAERDKNGMNWAKKSMILCGLDVGNDGIWKVEQLSKNLREIVAEHQDAFRKGYDEAVQSVSL